MNYKILHFARGAFKVLAWLGLFLGIFSAIVMFSSIGIPQTQRSMAGSVSLFMGVLYLFLFLVASSVLKLLLDIRSRLR